MKRRGDSERGMALLLSVIATIVILGAVLLDKARGGGGLDALVRKQLRGAPGEPGKKETEA